MDFSLSLAEASPLLTPAVQKQHILALNRTLRQEYGLQLTPEDAEMLVQTADRAMAAEGLIQFGEGITPRLIHWFLPSGWLGDDPAGRAADLTAAFCRLKGDLQALYDEADDPECILSDNAIIDYMYRFYVSPNCGGDVREMLAQAERILVGTMRRLLEQRAAERKQRLADVTGDSEARALYADLIQREDAASAYEDAYEQEQYDYAYHEEMRQDVFGNYLEDYDEDTAVHTRGTYAEELEETLRRNPAFLLPSAAQETEWAEMTAEWEAQDAAEEAE